jgi:hypothetical protein
MGPQWAQNAITASGKGACRIAIAVFGMGSNLFSVLTKELTNLIPLSLNTRSPRKPMTHKAKHEGACGVPNANLEPEAPNH